MLKLAPRWRAETAQLCLRPCLLAKHLFCVSQITAAEGSKGFSTLGLTGKRVTVYKCGHEKWRVFVLVHRFHNYSLLLQDTGQLIPSCLLAITLLKERFSEGETASVRPLQFSVENQAQGR